MGNEQSLMQTLEQGRAYFAYEQVQSVAGERYDKEYKAYVKKIPMLIKTNGLGAAIAFVDAKSKGKVNNSKLAYEAIYEQITEWLKKDEKLLVDLSEKNLTEAIVLLESRNYRAVTVEVLALFNWLRRFAEALIEGEAKDEN
jgi:CRISPR-associated protein Cmr5